MPSEAWITAAQISGFVAWYALTINAVIGASTRLGRHLFTAKQKRVVHTNLAFLVSSSIGVHIFSAVSAHKVCWGTGVIFGVTATLPVLLVMLLHGRAHSPWFERVHRMMLVSVGAASTHALLVGSVFQRMWSIVPAVASLTVLVNALCARRYKTVEKRLARIGKERPVETNPARAEPVRRLPERSPRSQHPRGPSGGQVRRPRAGEPAERRRSRDAVPADRV